MKVCPPLGFTAPEVESGCKSFSCCPAPFLQSGLVGREVELIVPQHLQHGYICKPV